jgi:Eukaryotic aspartyl protease
MWSSFSLLFLSFVFASAEPAGPQFAPRFGSISLPLHSVRSLSRRDVGNGTAAHSSLTPVAASSNRQQYVPVVVYDRPEVQQLCRSYFSVIQLGQISLRVALDTASSDLWVISSACTTQACTKVPRYPLAYQSPTFVAVNDNSTSFMAEYADGTGVYFDWRVEY